MSINLKDVTLFMFSGGGNNIEQTLKVMQHCQRLVSFGDSLLVIDRPTTLIDRSCYLEVPNATFNDYQKFVVHKLTNYIKTSHVLICHTDGFIINPNKWQDSWLNYDYIGAPWPQYWHLKGIRGGNGGFCLRSKKLLDLTSIYTSYDPDTMNTQSRNEDQYLCVEKRDELINKGIVFAPLDVAAQFSLEAQVTEYPNRTYNDCFGFHGNFAPWQKEIQTNLMNGTL